MVSADGYCRGPAGCPRICGLREPRVQQPGRRGEDDAHHDGDIDAPHAVARRVAWTRCEWRQALRSLSDAAVAFRAPLWSPAQCELMNRIYPCRRTRRRRLPLSMAITWRPRRLPARHLHPLPSFSPPPSPLFPRLAGPPALCRRRQVLPRCVKRIRRRLLLIALTLSLIPRPSPGVLGGAAGVRGVHRHASSSPTSKGGSAAASPGAAARPRPRRRRPTPPREPSPPPPPPLPSSPRRSASSRSCSSSFRRRCSSSAASRSAPASSASFVARIFTSLWSSTRSRTCEPYSDPCARSLTPPAG